jgi:hypothetical protein
VPSSNVNTGEICDTPAEEGLRIQSYTSLPEQERYSFSKLERKCFKIINFDLKSLKATQSAMRRG